MVAESEVKAVAGKPMYTIAPVSRQPPSEHCYWGSPPMSSGGDFFVIVEDAVLERTPELGRAELNPGSRAGARMCRRSEDGSTGLGERNFDLNFHGFLGLKGLGPSPWYEKS